MRLILEVARQEGIRSLYTGCTTLIIVSIRTFLLIPGPDGPTNSNFDDQGTAGKAAVRFVSYDMIRNSLSDEHGKLSAGGGILAGMAAGAVESILAVTPTERIKTAL